MDSPSPRDALLAPYACQAEQSRGRLHREPESATRSVFQRDRDRIVHSGAFRKLQYKTQVFVYHEGDYFRTRLTHSLEVAQIARSIARQLGLNEDLAEALALAHDLGHTPFGHAGESVLQDLLEPYGGFDHNEQTFRILTELEAKYAGFDGLNLTWESLEGIAKHNGPLPQPRPALTAFSQDWDLELSSYASAEAQVAALADDIAYTNHDIDDGLRAGLLTVESLRSEPLADAVFAEVIERYGELEQGRLVHEAVRRLIDRMVSDLLAETRQRIAQHRPDSPGAVRAMPTALVSFSEEMRRPLGSLRRFMFRQMYRHYLVNRMTKKAKQVMRDLFEYFYSDPQCLPERWASGLGDAPDAVRARRVADYIAGMTDRYALELHRKLFDPYPN